MTWVEIDRDEWQRIVDDAGGLGALGLFSCLTDPDGQYGPRQVYTAWGRKGDLHPLVDITDYKGNDGRTERQVCRKFVPDDSVGTFTWSVGSGVSDPVPYDAPGDVVQRAFEQAAERNTTINPDAHDDIEETRMPTPSATQSEALEILKELADPAIPTEAWDGSDLHVKFKDQSIAIGRDGTIMWGD